MRAFRLPSDAPAEFYAGVIPSSQPFVLANLIDEANSRTTVVICSKILDSRRLIATTPQFLSESDSKESPYGCVLFPAIQHETEVDPIPERLREEIECDRLSTLTHLANRIQLDDEQQHLIVFTTPDGLFSPVPPIGKLLQEEVRLVVGQRVDFEELKTRLGTELDYYSEAICERPGQFAIRGGLIDVYPLNAPAPVRLDFFGDELESIREFDPTTQRSLKSVRELTIASGKAVDQQTTAQSIFGYFGKSVNWIVIEQAMLKESHPAQFQIFENMRDQRAALPTLYNSRDSNEDNWIVVQELETDPEILEPETPATVLDFSSLDAFRDNPLETTIGFEKRNNPYAGI